jgi:hypothetical protein
MDGWKDALVAGLGGGALYGFLDGFLSGFLGQTPIAGVGITLKDVATILLSKFAADKTSGMLSTAFKGAVVIGIYKVVYPQFIEPLIKGFIPKPTTTAPITTAPTPTAPAPTVSPLILKAQSYIASKTGVWM